MAGPASARASKPGPPPAATSDADCQKADSHCFQLDAVSLEGVTAYKPGVLAQAYEAFLTREVDTPDLVRIAAAVTDRYRADGYFLSRAVVPPQLRGGHVAEIRVYEGYIDEVSATGDGATLVKRLAARIRGRRPLRLSELQQFLRLLADTPGLRVQSHLEPVADDPAKHRLVVVARLQRETVTAYVDNRGPHGVGPWQASMRAAFNSAIKAGDELALTLLTVPDHIREFTYAELGYGVPIGDGGARLRGTLGVSKSTEGGDPISKVIGGESWETTLSLLNPVVLTRTLAVWAGAVLDARHIEHHWTPATGYNDDVHALRGLIEATDSADGHSTNAFAQVSGGDRGHLDPAAFHGLSRSGASPQFVKVNAHLSRYQDLGPHAGLYVSADGQWSPSRLMTSEQFGVGGAPYGRGYNYDSALGDRGLAGTVELRAGFNPRRAGVTFLQGYTFFDAGRVWSNGAPGTQSLASAGAGVRIRFGDRTTLGLEAARRLTTTLVDPKKGWRPFVYLSTAF